MENNLFFNVNSIKLTLYGIIPYTNKDLHEIW